MALPLPNTLAKTLSC